MSVLPLEGGATGLVEVFSSALTSIQGDVMEYVKVALPIALAILGVFIAVKLGIKFFKTSTK
ncbi:MAG: hypothetical protein Q4B62_08835 [Clostridiaceae bacterium]|nr:hypothetical protein [Clostridiaceae bacterium]MDO4495876.1 hypothetical protein [Clostridiaceae bacterium]